MSASAGVGAIGVDLVEIAAFARKLGLSPGLEGRIFTDLERAAAATLAGAARANHLAGRFAAKEAVLKALRCGISGDVAPTDIETLAAPDGAPILALTGAARRLAGARGLAQGVVSISHDGGFAIAFVMFSA